MNIGENILGKYEKGSYEGEYPTISPEDWETLKKQIPKTK